MQYTFFPITQKSKDNQTIKFGQLTEYDMKSYKICVGGKPYTKCAGENFAKLFSKNKKLSKSLDE